MGRRMDDLHTPTVPSGPTSSQSRGFDASTDKRSLMELVDLKAKMEEELSALSGVLDSHGVTMTTSLTTIDDFPRSDIDVAQIRTTRSRIIHLKNDYKALLKRIEDGLHARHAEYAASNPPPSSNAPTSSQQHASSTQQPQSDLGEMAFAKINSVAPSSPAEEAGLKAGDRVKRIGDVTWLNHEKLSKVAETVQSNQGKRLLVRVSRTSAGQDAEDLELGLVPRTGWGGRGLLGCHILPL